MEVKVEDRLSMTMISLIRLMNTSNLMIFQSISKKDQMVMPNTDTQHHQTE
jgi:hypothetical protein